MNNAKKMFIRSSLVDRSFAASSLNIGYIITAIVSFLAGFLVATAIYKWTLPW